jgi:hypothetical protein
VIASPRDAHAEGKVKRPLFVDTRQSRFQATAKNISSEAAHRRGRTNTVSHKDVKGPDSGQAKAAKRGKSTWPCIKNSQKHIEAQCAQKNGGRDRV